MLTLLLFMSVAQVDAGAQTQLVIWSGGATREAAEAALETWSSSPVVSDVQLAGGFPRVLESRTVEGLKPGFFVVALGVCASEQDETVRLIDAVEPQVYTRAVSLPLACPTFQPEEDVSRKLFDVRETKVKEGTLSMVIVTERTAYAGGEYEELRWHGWVALRGRATTELQAIASTGQFSQPMKVEVVKGALVLSEERAMPNCIGSSNYENYSVVTTFRVVKGQLSVTTRERLLKQGSCGE